MKYELRKNHEGVRKIFARSLALPGEENLLGEDAPEAFPYLLASVEAPSWLEAKRLFALPLSEIQTKIASGLITHFELFGKHAPEGFLGASHDPQT